MKIIDFILDIIYPPICFVCDSKIPLRHEERDICNVCKNILQPKEKDFSCKICNRETKGSDYCNICKKKIRHGIKFYFTKNYYLFEYMDLGQNVVQRFKYKGQLYLSKSFSRLFKEWYRGEFSEVDVIIPVPMYKDKEKKRGYNQSDFIAKMVSDILNIEYKKILIRVKNTIPQSKLSVESRYKNLNNVFELNRNFDIMNKNILLVDDIYTSGSTVNNCAKVLMKNGARSVVTFTLAMTEYRRKDGSE
ncbi:MAG: ComF family protein [Lachnospirales bacterium]